MATGFDKDREVKKAAGSERLNRYANQYELQTICSMFPALNPDDALSSNDDFIQLHLLSNLEKGNFDKKYQELLSKRQKK